MAPRRIGRCTSVSLGSRPRNFNACDPTHSTSRLYLCRASTEGSLSTTPCVGAYTIVLTVPKSIAKSSLKNPLNIPISITSLDYQIRNLRTDTATHMPTARHGQGSAKELMFPRLGVLPG